MSAPRGKPPLPVSVNERGYTINGQKYPRVTNIVGCLPKPALVGWAAKAVAEYAVQHQASWMALPAADAIKLLKGAPWSQRDAAADRGTVIHRVVESFVNGQEMPDCSEDELNVAIAAERFLLEHKPEVLASELVVYSPSRGYAGTCDLWCTMFGDAWLLDWKTGKGVYPDYAIQLTAYALADRAIINGEDVEWAPNNGMSPNLRLGIVHLTAHGYVLYEVMRPIEDLAVVFDSLLRIKAWLDVANDTLCVGSAVLPREMIF